MKQIYLITLLFFLTLSAAGQNAWFLPFGQSTGQVKELLKKKHYLLDLKEEKDLNRLLAIIRDDKQVEYAFQNDRLYATSLTKYYTDKQEIKDREESCMKYLDFISSGNVSKTTEGKKTCFTVVTGSRVIKFYTIPEGEGKVLQLTSMSRIYGNVGETDAFGYELRVLQATTTRGEPSEE